jgi:molybdopterin-guanine dinucleotide biosynthesis protein A
MSKVIGILLLGGKSSRMGTRKDNLLWQGRPLWQNLFDRLVSCTGNAANVYISGRKDHANAIIDLVPNQGPLMGLYSVVKTLKFSGQLVEGFPESQNLTEQNQYILVLPVDMPLVESTDLKELLQFEGDACVWGDLPLPVCFRYTENLFSILQEIVLSCHEPHSFQHLLKHLQVEHKPIAGEQSKRLQSTNTPREWEAIHEFKNQSGSIEISLNLG